MEMKEKNTLSYSDRILKTFVLLLFRTDAVFFLRFSGVLAISTPFTFRLYMLTVFGKLYFVSCIKVPKINV